jgi:hypothetical protein
MKPQHRALAYVDMSVADMQDREAVEARGQPRAADLVGVEDYPLGISAPAPVKAGQLQDGPDDGMDRIPVFDVKEIEALSEDPGFVVGLDSEALAGMQPSKPSLKD